MDAAQALRQMAWNPSGDPIRQRMPAGQRPRGHRQRELSFPERLCSSRSKRTRSASAGDVLDSRRRPRGRKWRNFRPLSLVEQGNVIVVTLIGSVYSDSSRIRQSTTKAIRVATTGWWISNLPSNGCGKIFLASAAKSFPPIEGQQKSIFRLRRDRGY
jgi:hypothetical protein